MAPRIVLTYADYAAIPNDGKRGRPVALPLFPDLFLDPAATWP